MKPEEKMNLNGNDFTTLTVRVKKLRREQTKTQNQTARKIIETRINHIKETVGNHLTTDFSETNIDTFLKL